MMVVCMTSRKHRQPEQVSVARVLRPEDMVGDVDRQRRSELVGRAFADGLVDLAELEALLNKVLRARTVGDLDAATEMLPSGWVAASERADAAARRTAARRSAAWRAVQAYLGVMALLVGIWGLTALIGGATYFWPIWPALGWGVPLLVNRSDRGDNDRDASPDDEPIARVP